MRLLLSSLMGSSSSGSSSNSLSNWVVKTPADTVNSIYDASAKERIMANTTTASFSIKLPSNPLAGDTIIISDYIGSFSTNNLTILNNNNKINGVLDSFVLDVSNATTSFQFIDINVGWKIIGL